MFCCATDWRASDESAHRWARWCPARPDVFTCMRVSAASLVRDPSSASNRLEQQQVEHHLLACLVAVTPSPQNNRLPRPLARRSKTPGRCTWSHRPFVNVPLFVHDCCWLSVIVSFCVSFMFCFSLLLILCYLFMCVCWVSVFFHFVVCECSVSDAMCFIMCLLFFHICIEFMLFVHVLLLMLCCYVCLLMFRYFNVVGFLLFLFSVFVDCLLFCPLLFVNCILCLFMFFNISCYIVLFLCFNSLLFF